MKRPSHHYADYLSSISYVAFILLFLALLWALADAVGILGDPMGRLIEGWREGRSPFWSDGVHPAAWALLIPPLIPLLGALYLSVVYARHRRPLYSFLALLQGVVLTGASLFFLIRLL
jgi:hypothetical protein